MGKKKNGSAATNGTGRAQFTVETKRAMGPVHNRSCTDLLCLLLFIVFLLVWGYMILFFYRNVDIQRTLNPSDIYGNVCGQGKFRDRKYLAFFNIFACATSFEASIIDGCKTPQVCVEHCPNITFSINAFSNLDVKAQEAQNAICLYDVRPTADTIERLVNEGKCARYYFNSEPVGGRCLPSVLKIMGETGVLINEITHGNMTDASGNFISAGEVLQNNEIVATLMKAMAMGSKIASDIAKTWKWMLVGLFAVMVLAFLWIYLMQFLASYMVWLSILAIFALNGLGLWYSLTEYVRLTTPLNHTLALSTNQTANVMLQSAVFSRSLGEEVEISTDRTLKYIRANSLSSISSAGGGPGQPSGRLRMGNTLQFDLNLGEKLADELNVYRSNPTTWLVASGVLGVTLVISSLVMLCLCRRIKLAIAVIEEASLAVNAMKSTLFFPVVPYLLKVGVLALWLGAVVIIAAGSHPQYRFPNNTLCVPETLSPEHQAHLGQQPNQRDEVHAVDDDNCTFVRPFTRNYVYAAHAFNLFGIIWMLFFLMGICYMTLSGAFASYYWSFNKEEVPFFAIAGAFYRCVRFHLGSVAFGSLLVAVVRFIRVILEYVDKKCKKYADNAVVKVISCLLRCCFWCLENFIKFINKNAFIMIAIYGKAFCASAKDAFFLLLDNGIRAVVLNALSDFLLFLSKLAVTGIVSAGAFFVLTNQVPELVTFEGLNFYWAPLALFVILSYIVTSTFFNVYDVAIETIFLCYLEDSKINDGSPERPYYMTKSLAKTLDQASSLTSSLFLLAFSTPFSSTKSLSKSITMSSIYPLPVEVK